MIQKLLDNTIAVFSPAWAVHRAAARATLSQINGLIGSKTGYNAGKVNRLSPHNAASSSENTIPRGQISLLKARSWDLFRNNPHARKIVRSIVSKTIGRGMTPQPLATNEDGLPDMAFRERAKKIWEAVVPYLDSHGRPGFGGRTLHELARIALKAVVLSGESLVKLRSSNSSGASVDFSVQLVDAGRLDESSQGERLYYGIEFNEADARIKYHIVQTAIGGIHAELTRTVVEVPAGEMLHVYMSDDIDQHRGVPWFSACIDKTRDIGDYEYNELKAAAMAACVVLGYRRSSGQNSFGLQADNWDLTDNDGNKVTNISPGMLMDLGNSGELQGFNPQRPNANAAEFLNYQLRSVAAGMPGTKPSTVTGDYKNATFSSERASDNDAWPEIEELQDWFSQSFYQPIYEQVIRAAVIKGLFDSVHGWSIEDFANKSANYMAAVWRGPAQRSVNPVDDVKASAMRVWYGLSSPQRESAAMSANWQEIQAETAEWIARARLLDLPTELIASVITPNPQVSMQVPADATDNTEGNDASIAK